jgi:O-antigen/teichoic acid export membrane protein
MSIKKKAVSGAFWTTIQTFSSQGIGFIVSIILARLLEPEQFGLIGMLGVVMALSNTIINGGLTQSLIRSSNLVEEDYSTVFFFNLIGSLFIYFIVFLSAPFIADFYKQEQLESVIKVYCLTLIINAFSTVQMTRLTKSMDFKIQMKISIPSLIIGSSVGILSAFSLD